MKSDDLHEATARVLDRDDIEGVLGGSFYAPQSGERERPARVPGERPTHYKVICISMYTDDLERLDEMVQNLKARGLTKANRSALIRYALGSVKLDDVPKGL
ncbi:MAG TPA: hypothetical protein VGQ57_21290 [Polyangiaceae bacterium]|jgi:hypothetical protein|nr:hypothetical protein [Polyangiaceae bacterium]